MSRASRIERDWMTLAGLQGTVLLVNESHRCGYVGVPPGHPLYGCVYSQPANALGGKEPWGVFEVHGGLTWSGFWNGDDLWRFGFDCHHDMDGSLRDEQPYFPVRPLEYVVSQCESLARQLANYEERLREMDE